MTELFYLDAVELSQKYRSKEISPKDVMIATIQRSEAVNPNINAISEAFYNKALDKATKLEQAFMRGDTLGDLAGIPIITKEKHPIKGESISHGLSLEKTPIATESHVIIDRVLQEGAIIHSRSTTPEFSCATFTQSSLWGVTHNPYNPQYSPGGSSGGSAAAVAAGMATLATASDIGGSTRLPASFTGIVGYKPPYGKIPGMGVLANDHYRSDGPLARSIRDVALLTNVMAGLDYSDHATFPTSSHIPLNFNTDLSGRKIALCITLGDFDVSNDIVKNTRNIAKTLENAGAIIEEVFLPWKSEEIMRIASIHYAHILVPGLEEELKKASQYADYIKEFIKITKNIAGNSPYLESLQGEFKIQQDLVKILTKFDALICPVSAISGLTAGEQYLDGITMPSGKRLNHYWEAHMAVPFNIANRLPVLSVPSGMADCGIPTGVQIVGRPWDENTVFEIGATIEQLAPWNHLWQKILL